MLTDHFWNVQYREFVSCMDSQTETPIGSASSYYTITYPLLPFSYLSQKREYAVSLPQEALSRRDQQLILDDLSFLDSLPRPSNDQLQDKELIEAFSHPIMSSINRLLSLYLIDNTSEQSPCVSSLLLELRICWNTSRTALSSRMSAWISFESCVSQALEFLPIALSLIKRHRL